MARGKVVNEEELVRTSLGTSSDEAVATTPDASRLSKMILSASISIASCSSPKSLKQAILSHEAVRIL